MDASLDPASRPSRLSASAHTLTLILLTASFVTGMMVWRGQVFQAAEMVTPPWLRAALVIHGSLNPFLCGLFGYLACQHIRLGWKLRANLASGLLLEASFLGLILTGLGLYYTGSDRTREWLKTIHDVLGLILPISLAFHLVLARRWVKTISK